MTGLRKSRWLLAALIAVLFVTVGVPSATAVHDLGLFELDENATDSPVGAPDDWNTLIGGGGSADLFTVFTDPVESDDDDILDGGGSKDVNDITDWSWKGAEPNDKNDIEHAFAAAYEYDANPDPDIEDLQTVLYFGADRLDNSGAAALGFWFLRQPVEEKTIDADGDGDTENVFVYEDTNILAQHSTGDTLVQTDFTNGGSISRIQGYAWNVAGGVAVGNDGLKRIVTGAECELTPTPPSDSLCGEANETPVPVPANWPTLTVGGVTDRYFHKPPGGVVAASDFPTATFFEGGINATKLLGPGFCAAQFLVETRQSPSESATLEDKAQQSFRLCDIDVTKTGPEKSKVGDDADYTITIKNNGAVSLFKQSITDTLLGDLAGDSGCGASLAPGESCSINYSRAVQPGDADPLPNEVTAVYNRLANLTGDTASGSASHSVNLFQPKIGIDKECDNLSKVGDRVDCAVAIANTSSDDAPKLVIESINDTIQGDLTDAAKYDSSDCGASLASGGSCTIKYHYSVPAGAPDPYVNTVTVKSHPDGFPNDIDAGDSDSVNLFQPSIAVDKECTDLSKKGDRVDCTVKVNNTSSADTPALVVESISDTVQGDLTLAANYDSSDCGANLAAGLCTIKYHYLVPDNAGDPYLNTVTVKTHPTGFTNDIDGSDSDSVNLFQPSITFDKSGEALSKIGDEVKYTLTLTNTSSSDTPDLVCKISDTAIGFSKTVTVASGKEDVSNPTFTIPVGAADPFPNKAEVACSPTGFPNVLPASDEHKVNLFQPALEVNKEADNSYSKHGDSIKYTVTIANKSSSDSPDLQIDKIADTIQGDLTDATKYDSSTCGTSLAFGASCEIKYTHTVGEPADADPLVNTVIVETHPTGFPNDVDAKDSVTVDLVHPKFEVTKVCKAEPINREGPAVFTITFKNTGDAEVHVEPSEGAPFNVLAGATKSYEHSIAGPFSATVDNTVTGTVTLAAKYGLSNSYQFSAKDSCDVKGKATVAKTVSGQAPAAGQSFTFELRQGASPQSDGTVLESKTTDASGNISFTTQLVPGSTYQLCEWVFPGWNTNLAGDGPLFVPNSVVPPALPNPNVNNLVVCANFTATSGQTRTFTVDNTPPPGGRALTIGFWKNWASCASSNGKGQKPMLDLALAYASQQTTNPPGGLVVSAQNPGSLWPNYAAAWYLVLKGNPASTEKNILAAPDCLKAVNLLNKSTIDGKGKKSSDPLFNMTAQLVAAQLNRFMGAGISGITITNIDRAVLLNGKYKFNGLTYSPSLTSADASLANCLATQLDNYNNNRAVSSCP